MSDEQNVPTEATPEAPDFTTLIDHLNDLAERSEDNIIQLYEIIRDLQPLDTNDDGQWKYSDEQRLLIMSMAQVYQDAGYGE